MPTTKKMTSFNPHIFHAFYDWLIENDITPHLVVNANRPGVVVPRQFVQNGTIILSISPLATREMSINRRDISFVARFQGQDQHVVVPYTAMQELFAVETSTSFPISLWMNEQDDDMALEDGSEDDEMHFAPVVNPVADVQASSADKASDDGPSFTIVPKSKD
ncbi:MAG: ClpXP protease specificity-enhancing factor [Candidatus Anaerobiospirillum merdipullorum]|uniref:ClpXP protease specificity-enhancing factor n=1 Tax=Candidatus Anaerobiospirillum merdipullorum TaxID=2838450 RepID=A0A9E2NT66_9GAMM|nr:ClpXP protease specificity-enhancing factor [Candidatus Anaerobiospirillum merdipullorum]